MWIYKEKEINKIEDLPKGSYGFVYRITHVPTGRYYIGKKALVSNRTKKLTKKEQIEYRLQHAKGRVPKTKRVISEAKDWQNYWGSSKDFQVFVKEHNKSDFRREIVEVVFTKKQLTYTEAKYLFSLEVLKDPKSFNDNIQSHFFRRDLEGLD